MIKAILWDNDGVLVDTEKHFFAATRKTLASVEIDLTRDLFIEFSLIKGFGLSDYLEKHKIDTRRCDDLKIIRNEEYSKLLKQDTQLIEGVKQTLKLLYGRYRMGIVTSSRKDHFEIIHRKTEILGHFDLILTREDYKKSKPDPEPYLKALDIIGVKPDECLVVEDSASGLLPSPCASGL